MDRYHRFRTTSTQDSDTTEVITVKREATPDNGSLDFDGVVDIKFNKKQKSKVFPIDIFEEHSSCLPISRAQSVSSLHPFLSQNYKVHVEHVRWLDVVYVPDWGKFIGLEVTATVDFQRRNTKIRSGDVIRVTGQSNDLWLQGVTTSNNKTVTFPITILTQYQEDFDLQDEIVQIPPRYENETVYDRIWEFVIETYARRANWFLFITWIALLISIVGIISLDLVPQQNFVNRLQETVCTIEDYTYEALNRRITDKTQVELEVSYTNNNGDTLQSKFMPHKWCEGMECTQQIHFYREFQCFYDERDNSIVRENDQIRISQSVTAVSGFSALVLALQLMTFYGKCCTLKGCLCPLYYS